MVGSLGLIQLVDLMRDDRKTMHGAGL
jgi:hypothetical protein